MGVNSCRAMAALSGGKRLCTIGCMGLGDCIKACRFNAIEMGPDGYPVVKDNYYHPRMLGSWSIKAVMPTIDPDMDYATLEGINEGTAASDGFVEAIQPDVSPERKAELEEQLRRYCRFDTEAMVEVVRYFTR